MNVDRSVIVIVGKNKWNRDYKPFVSFTFSLWIITQGHYRNFEKKHNLLGLECYLNSENREVGVIFITWGELSAIVKNLRGGMWN